MTVAGPDAEARAWPGGNAWRLVEFRLYDWCGDDPYTLGEPVRVGPEAEILIGGE
ncbi:hypothetical protein [Deinococcus apachensis]|uniref:hypothetical protein n=1 Tax=Deinococcus apachensis TaxID=309886 RepID=UPI000367469E|nr:hypothetical protein [Deinococcus apachensis]